MTHDNSDSEEELDIPQFNRDEERDEAGVSQVLIEEFVEDRLPVLLGFKAEVDAGKTLSAGEVELMSRIVEKAEDFNHFVYEFPEYEELMARLIDLYDEISQKALENERRPKDS